MGKGGGSKQQVTTTKSDISPELRPYRQEILGAAQALFRGGAPAYTSTPVAPSARTLGALSGMEQAAAGFSPFLQTAEQTLMQNLTGTNPLFQQALQPTIQAAMQPAISAGRYGSGYAQKAIAEAVAPQVYQAQQAAMGQLPSFYAMSMLPAETQATVGAVREEIERQQLEEAAQEAQYPYASQYGLLSDYANIFAGLPLGSEGQTIRPISKPSRLGQLASIGMQGLGMLGGAGSGSLLSNLAMNMAPSFFGAPSQRRDFGSQGNIF